MPDTLSHRILNGLTIVLTGFAVLIVAYYAYQRYSTMEREATGAATNHHANRGFLLPPMKFMARNEAHRFLERYLGSYLYPGTQLRDDPNSPTAFHAAVKDQFDDVVAYFAKSRKLYPSERDKHGDATYFTVVRIANRNVRIDVSPSADGATITYSLPDMIPQHQP